MLRKLLAQRQSVSKLHGLVRGQVQHSNADIKRYESQMEDALGRAIKIQFDGARQCGKLTLDFYGLDDLDLLATTLGFKTEE